MSRWLADVLARVRELARKGRVRFTHKSLCELAALDLGLDEDDCCDVLIHLAARDFSGRTLSTISDEWMYVFRPSISGVRIYIKIILRSACIIVSFHEERHP